MHIYHVASGTPIVTILRPARTPKGTEVRTVLKHVTKRLRRHWSKTSIVWRAEWGPSRCGAWSPRLGIRLSDANFAAVSDGLFLVYPVHVMTRKSFGLITRKLSVTESQRSGQFRGTISRRKLSVASAN